MNSYIYKKDRLKMTSLTIVFDAGSNLEPAGKKGTMHLMEHLICKTFKDMYPMFTQKSIDWNAYTSEERILVYFEGLASILTSDIKIEIVKKLTGGIACVTEDEFETEKNVVLQEYMDTIVDTTNVCELNILRKYWNYYGIIGCEEDIKNFTYQDVLDTYEKYFRNPIKIVEVGPDKTPELAGFCVDNKLKHKKFSFGKYKNELIPIGELLKVPVYMMSEKVVVPADYPCLKVGLKMLTEGLESPYYNELRVKRGLSYYTIGSIDKNVMSGIMSIAACTTIDRADELADVMCNLTDQLYNHLTEERYAQIMENMKIKKEKEKILKYMYTAKYTGLSKLKMPNDLDKISLEEVRYKMSRYFGEMRIIRGDDF